MNKVKLVKLVMPVVLSALLVVGCSGGAEKGEKAQSSSITIQGSDTMVNLGQALAEEYMNNENQNASISVTGGGSGTGIAALLNNNVDIAQSSRQIKNEEIETAKKNGVEVYEFVVGQDGLAVVVNSENPIKNLTKAQIKDIFVGKIKDWSELGWEDGGKITLYSRQSNSGTYVYFNENIMDGEDWAEGTMFIPGSAAIIEGLKADMNGIGYSGIGYIIEGTKSLSVAPNENEEYISPLIKENVDSGKYPISRPLYFYTNGIPKGEALSYLNFVLDQKGQDVIAKSGYFSYTKEQGEQNMQTLKDAGIE